MNNAVQLQQLEQQYQNTLIQYKQALLDYRNAAQMPLQKEYKETDSAGYWGQKSIAWYKPVNNVKECEALCSADSKCGGGLLFQGTGKNKGFGPYCFTFENGTTTKYNVPQDYPYKYTAFEKPNLSQYKEKLDLVESQLRNVVVNIQTTVKKTPSDATNQKQQTFYKNLLESKYDTLVKERTQLENEEQEFNNLSAKYDDTFISTVQENSQNSLWIFVTIAVVGVTAGILIM